jgi:hypothetical protein
MKIKQTLLILAMLLGFSFLITPPAFSAITTCGGVPLKSGENCCGGVATSLISCDQPGGKKAKVENTGLWGILMLVVNILSAGVGIAAVGGVVYGSIMYTTSGGSVEQTKKARAIIANTIVGIVLYLATWAFLNYLVPGGIFK